MTGPTNLVETALLDGLINDPAFSGFPSLWLGLSSTEPLEDGTGITEPTTGDYARVETTAASWAAAVAGAPSTKANGVVISFVQASADWLAGADIAYFALFDANVAGDAVWTGTIVTPKPVLNGDTAEFAVGDLVLQLGDPLDFPIS